MIRNFLLVTYRTLTRNKSYALINIAGLALGMAAYMLISAYVRFENSYDHFPPDGANIYRVESQFYKGDQLVDNWATSTDGYAKAMKDNFPEIGSFARINWSNSERVVSYKDVKFREDHVCFADTNFFSFFSYPLLKGDPTTVLKDVNTIAISESAAKKYFGKANPIGQFLEINTITDKYHCMVTGVFKDVPPNSTMQFNFLMSWATSPEWQKDTWYLHESYSFVKPVPGTDIHEIEAKFPALAERYKKGPALKDLKWAIQLIPLADIHLNPAKQYEIEAKGNRRAVSFLGMVALVILIIACVNYINLSTAKAIERGREVGIRKVSGARPAQLIGQFLLESTVINLMALALAVFMVGATDFSIRHLMGNGLSYGLLFDGSLYLRSALVFMICIFASGIYPALVLTGLKPITVLKGRYSFSKGGIWLRKGLVTFQFAISLTMITWTFAVYRQIVYMSGQDLGVNISQTLVAKAPASTEDYSRKIAAFKNALLAIPGVTGVAGSGAVPGREVAEFLANRRYGADLKDERAYEMLKVDHDFIKLYDLQLVAGRDFDKARPSDSTGLVLNEAAVRQFGFASNEEAIGQRVWLEVNSGKPNEIIGVIKDYHQQSLQQGFTPIILFMDPNYGWIPTRYYSLKMNARNMTASVEQVRQTWKALFPESSFDFFFLDAFYNRQYQQERQYGNIFLLFSALAVFIACMGLFGLTAYATARRNKEIGVRKVLGASVQNIVSLLTWDSLRLIIVAGLVALPVSLWLIAQWLQGYAFRSDLTWWQFAIPVVALVLVAIVTTAYLTIRSALMNPVLTLRDE